MECSSGDGLGDEARLVKGRTRVSRSERSERRESHGTPLDLPLVGARAWVGTGIRKGRFWERMSVGKGGGSGEEKDDLEGRAWGRQGPSGAREGAWGRTWPSRTGAHERGAPDRRAETLASDARRPGRRAAAGRSPRMEALAAECRAEAWRGRGGAASVADKPGRGAPLAQRRPLGTARARWDQAGSAGSGRCPARR